MTTPIRKIIDAAGGPVALAKSWGITYFAVNTFERQGYMPLPRAKDAVERYGEQTGVTLRELVRKDLREAMDVQQGADLLN